MKCTLIALYTFSIIYSALARVIEDTGNVEDSTGLEPRGLIKPACVWESFIKIGSCIDKSQQAYEFAPGEDYYAFACESFHLMGLADSKELGGCPTLKEGAKLPMKCIAEGICGYLECSLRSSVSDVPSPIEHLIPSQASSYTKFGPNPNSGLDSFEDTSEDSDEMSFPEYDEYDFENRLTCIEKNCHREALITMDWCINEMNLGYVDIGTFYSYVKTDNIIRLISTNLDAAAYDPGFVETDVEEPLACMGAALGYYTGCVVKELRLFFE